MAITLPGRSEVSARRDLSAPWRHVDVVLLGSTVFAAILGTLLVFSATRGPEGPADTFFVKRQALFMVLGFGLMAGMMLLDYQKLRTYAPFIYGVMVFFLLAVVSPLGQKSKGAQSWFSLAGFQLQPSEFAKLGLIIALATLLEHWRGDLDLRRLGIVLLVAGLPMGLIMLQPDLGTALVFMAIVMAMLLIGGVKARHLLLLTLAGVVVVFGVLKSDVLKDYQRDRLTTFLDPTNNKSGAAYNLNQALTAIQRGGMTGDGYMQGKQTQLGFVPEKQTDFIFTVLAEEFGFVGSATFLGCMAVMMWRILRAAQLARDQFGQLLCVGVLAMMVFHIFENVGMAMGIMPVTGIPLPLLSYGGSTTLTSFLALGLVQSVTMRRFR